jgi:ribosomal protein L15
MIDEFLPELISEGIAIKKGTRFEVDLTKTDYTKVLGSGRISNTLSINAIAFSSRATEKIESAGGTAIFALEETE